MLAPIVYVYHTREKAQQATPKIRVDSISPLKKAEIMAMLVIEGIKSVLTNSMQSTDIHQFKKPKSFWNKIYNGIFGEAKAIDPPQAEIENLTNPLESRDITEECKQVVL